MLPIVIFLASAIAVDAQVRLETYMDIGRNNVSEGAFVKNIFMGSYQYRKYTFEAGLQIDLISINPRTVTGLEVACSRELLVKDFPFSVKGYFMLNRFSDLLYETNWGLLFETRRPDHFIFELGTNYKAFNINSDAREEYNMESTGRSLDENFNLIYVVTAFLKPHSSAWNIGLSCTNLDYFVISQPTNPVFNLQTMYRLKPGLTIFLETWYKQAGIFNINANYFGYFFRGGIKWEL